MSTEIFDIDVAIIGAISSGKSMFLNALFSEHHAENKMKRTTMCPQIYIESNSDIDTNIYNRNQEINGNLLEAIKTLDDVIEIRHKVNIIDNLITSEYRKQIRLNIHDLPGLNDVRTKQIYYDYVKQHFHKYDIIIYVIDIKTALNTTDEAEVLDFVLNQIRLNKENYDINTRLIILVNKCDNMIIEPNNFILDTESGEYEEMYDQINKIINAHNKKYSVVYSMIPISCENAFIYNLLINAPNKLTQQQMNKIGSSYFGRIYWNGLKSCKEKMDRLISYSKNKDNTQIITSTNINSGFNVFKNSFDNLFNVKNNIYNLVLNKFKKTFIENVKHCEAFLNICASSYTDDKIYSAGIELSLILDSVIKFLEMTRIAFNITKLQLEKSSSFINIKAHINFIVSKFLSLIPICGTYSKSELERCISLKKMLSSLQVEYFVPELLSSFDVKLVESMMFSCNGAFQKLLLQMKSVSGIFDHKVICDILDVMNKHCNVTDVSKYVIDVFNCRCLFYTTNILIGQEKLNHENIFRIIKYYKNTYQLSNDVMCTIQVNIVLNMYKQIIEEYKMNTQNYSYFLNNTANSLLFQMDKFWNSAQVDNLIAKIISENKKLLQEIQYLASECRILVLSNKNYPFCTNFGSVSSLCLETSILCYLHEDITLKK